MVCISERILNSKNKFKNHMLMETFTNLGALNKSSLVTLDVLLYTSTHLLSISLIQGCEVYCGKFTTAV